MPTGVYQRKACSEEKKLKISISNKGKHFRPLSEESKKKISLSLIGNKRGFGKHHTEEVRKKISEKLKGEKSHLWKGGISKTNRLIRSSLEYRLWREAVFKRDNYTCIWCGDKTSGNLNADHIKSFADYPELRFAIDNGRTLCVPCHKTTENYFKRFKRTIKHTNV